MNVALFCKKHDRAARVPWHAAPKSGALSFVEIEGVKELSAVTELGAGEFDFLLDFSGGPSDGDGQRFPLGIWSFQTRGSKTIDRSITWREFAAGARTLDIALVVGLANGSARVLRSARFNLPLRLRDLDPILQACAQWAAWSAQEWAGKSFDTAIPWEARRALPLRAMLSAPARLTQRLWRRAVRHLFAEVDWNIGIIANATPEDFLTSGYRPSVRWLHWNERHPFYADPMVGSSDGKTFVLCESLDRRANRGHIDAFEISGGVARDQRPVMQEPSHLSYPFLLKHSDVYYCVPESAEKNCVELYRATSFPYEWARVCTLIEGFDACDSTLFRHDGRWWLFCTSSSSNSNLHLFAFYADRLTGVWQPHGRNPIKSDITSARPAGKPFFHQGQLYRPSQDCATTYGGALRINRILQLTPDDFAEEIVATLLPHNLRPYTAGTHTLSWDRDVCVIDGKRQYLTLRRLPYVLRREREKAAARLASRPRRLLKRDREAVR